MNYDDDDGGLDTSQDGKYETPERTPVSSPNSNNRKIIDTTIDLHDRVRGQNNGEVNNVVGNNIVEGHDNPLLEGEHAAQEDEVYDVNQEWDGGRKKRKRRKSRKRKRKSRKSTRKSRRSRRKSRRKH
jgi:hypothetical protein